MRIGFYCGLVSAMLGVLSCKPRNYNASEAKSANDSGAENATDQINPMAFNALKIWIEGKGDPVLDYPRDYETAKPVDSQNVFLLRETDIIKFAAVKDFVTHKEAVQYCKQQGLRLPVFQELFDFCFAPGPEMRKQRCSNVWSATLNTSRPLSAYNIDPISDVTVHAWQRDTTPTNVRCVGAR
jgi:hypothetical protein